MAARRGWQTIQLYVTTCFAFSWLNCYASPGYEKLMGRFIDTVNNGKDQLQWSTTKPSNLVWKAYEVSGTGHSTGIYIHITHLS